MAKVACPSSPLPAGLEPPPGLALPPGLQGSGARVDTRVQPPPGLAKRAAASAGGRKERSAAGRAPAEALPRGGSVRVAYPNHGGAPWEEDQSAFPAQEVTIRGLPNPLLSEPMMEVVLEQAGLLDFVLEFTTRTGKPCGEAVVKFSHPLAAEQCCLHFSGCQWDASGLVVVAQLAADGSEDESLLSAHAPAFVPGFMMHARLPERWSGKAEEEPLPINSDTSTEVGESEVDDEQEGCSLAVVT